VQAVINSIKLPYAKSPCDPTQPNPTHSELKVLDPTKPNPTHEWTQPMTMSAPVV